MDKELLAEVTIPNYIRKVKISEKRRPVYYKQGEVIPEKYKKNINISYYWINIKGKGVLLVDADGEPVIKNSRSVGTPKYKIINGQELHQLTLTDYNRSKIIKAIKEQMIAEINKLDPITKFPIRILCELYDTYYDYEYLKKDGKVKENIDWDVDNRGLFYCKAFPDVLSGSPYIYTDENGVKEIRHASKIIIPNDHRGYITQPPVVLFFPIENPEERKLVFKIYHDKREVIKNSIHYG